MAMSDKKNALYFVRIIGVLLVITMCVAALLALVNDITEERIAANKQADLEKALSNIFTDTNALNYENTNLTVDDKAFVELCKVKDGDTEIGYYAHVTPKGFKGKVEMLVGIDLNGNVKGIEIIASSETTGIGDKIKNPDYLKDVAGGKYDTISGATYSSKAVINGVKLALEAYGEYAKGGV